MRVAWCGRRTWAMVGCARRHQGSGRSRCEMFRHDEIAFDESNVSHEFIVSVEPDHTNGRTPITHTGVWEASLRLVGYISLAHARTSALTHRSDRSR